jgi:multidrug efflux pump subunit AcrA (membrane-fusion protein)
MNKMRLIKESAMKKIFLLLSIITILTILTACGNSGTTATPTVTAPVTKNVVASGHLIPNQFLYLSFLARAKVTAIPVKVGDSVKKGDVLMKLGDTEQAQAALRGANAELLAAQQDYDALIRTAPLAQAQAWLNWLNAQKARQVAARVWEKLDLNAIKKDIDTANTTINDRKKDLVTAQDNFDKYKNLAVDNTTRIDYENKLTKAQNDYNEALRKVEELTAKRDIVKAQLDLTSAAEQEALRIYHNTLNGADVDKLALAKVRLDASDAQVKAAQSALDNYTLTAPFDGTVVDINLLNNEMAGPEKWAVLIADTSSWYVNTSDLSELDVVNVKVGQPVILLADALPGVTMDGAVQTISSDPKNQVNDVLYTAHILVKNPDPRLKWGMTVEVTFPTE